MLEFFRQNSLIISKVFLCMEKSKNLEKNVSYPYKNITFLRGFDRKRHCFWNIENLIPNACFQMALNARKSCADSFVKIKTNDNRARFARSQQSSEKFESETSKLSPVNLSENVEILSVYIKERLTLCKDYNLSSFCHNPTP